MTRDTEYINQIIDKLRVVWECYPQQRLGQLIVNVAGSCNVAHGATSKGDLFYLDDDVLVSGLDRFIALVGHTAIWEPGEYDIWVY